MSYDPDVSFLLFLSTVATNIKMMNSGIIRTTGSSGKITTSRGGVTVVLNSKYMKVCVALSVGAGKYVGLAPSTLTSQSSKRKFIRSLGTVTLQNPTAPDGPVTLKKIVLLACMKLNEDIVTLLSMATR